MMHCNLNITSIMQYALAIHPTQKIVTLKSDGFKKHIYTYKDAFERVAQCAHALDSLKININAKIGTLAWNTYQHFELHYAIPCSERIYHTINPRLSVEQILHIIINAQDEVLFLEVDLVPIIDQIYAEIKDFVKYFRL